MNQNTNQNTNRDFIKKSEPRKTMLKRVKLLIPFLAFVILITLGMSGLYAEVFDSFGGIFNSGEKVDELIVQKASAYSASSLSSAIETVGSVNVLELTLGNDIEYTGKELTASPISVKGTSTFYLDVNGHNLIVNGDENGGISMGESTFYAVDTVGGGHIEVNTKGTGIFCKNLIFESGDLTVNAGDPNNDGYEGPDIPDGFTDPECDSNGIISSGNVDVDKLGYWGTWNPNNTNPNTPSWNGLPSHIYGTSDSGDAVRVTGVVTVGNDHQNVRNPCHVRLHSAGGAGPRYNFAVQMTSCGLRVGSDEWCVNDGRLAVNNLGGTFCSTGNMGLFANKVEFNGGQCEVYGACGGNASKFDQIGTYFSDPNGFDGHFYIGPKATVYSTTPTNTGGLFSYCCNYIEIRGTYYSGCNSGYYASNGDLMMNLETSFAGQPHNAGTCNVQKLGIGVDIGDIRILGTSAKVFLIGNGRTIMAGREPTGLWGYGYANNGVAANNNNFKSWKDGSVVRAISDGRTDYPAWISAEQWGRIESKNSDLSGVQNIPGLNYQLTHAGSFTAKDGAFVMSRSWEGGKANNSAALFCVGTSKTEKESGVTIEGNKNAQTKVYLLSDQYGIYTEHVSVRVGSNAFLSCDTFFGPTDLEGENAYVTYCYKSISNSHWRWGDHGGALVVEESGIMESHAKGANWGYSVGLDVAKFMTVKSGGTLRVSVDSNGTENADKHNYSLGVNVWGSTWIESGAIVQVYAGGTAFRLSSGKLNINGDKTYCSFVSRGGQFNNKSELDWANSHYGALTTGFGAEGIDIYGEAVVECSYEDNSGRKDSAVHCDGIFRVFDNATLRCSNAGVGITSYSAIHLAGNSTTEITSVKVGINCQYLDWSSSSSSDARVLITDNAKVNVKADQDGISAYRRIQIDGKVQVSVRCTNSSSTNGAGIWASPGGGDNALTINVLEGGYVSSSVPNSMYGMGTSGGDVKITGEGKIVAEGNQAGLYCGRHVNATLGKKAELKFYGNNGFGVEAKNNINISGTGVFTASGKRTGILAGKMDSNNEVIAHNSNGHVNISGAVTVNADGILSNTSSISSVSLVKETKTGDVTTNKTASSKTYSSLEALAKDKGGFYATISNTNRQVVLSAIGSSRGSDHRGKLFGRVYPTGGPEEIWYFEYIDSGTYKGSWTIKNYMNGHYLTIEGNGASGAKLVFAMSIYDKSHFYIKQSKFNFDGKTGNGNQNQYVIYTGLDGAMFNTTGTYGSDIGKFCIDLNGSIGQDVDGDRGTQINDNIVTHLWYNHDAGITGSGSKPGAAVFNANQIFSIDPIVDLGEQFTSKLKSLQNGQYLDFVGSSSYRFHTAGEFFEFKKDTSSLYPFSYQIKNSSVCLDMSGANTNRYNNITCEGDNNTSAQRFRLYYSIKSSAYSLKNVKSVWMVYVDDSKVMKQDVSYYNNSRRFELVDCSNDAIARVSDGRTSNGSVFPTSLYGNTITYKINLDTANVNTFILTTAASNTKTVHPARWTLYECDPSNTAKIGKKVDLGTISNTMNNASACLDKIRLSLSPSNTSTITTYYLVLEAQAGADFVGISDVTFLKPSVGVKQSAGISASYRIDLKENCKVYAAGQGYGLRSGLSLRIDGKETENVSDYSNLTAYGIGESGIGIYAGSNITIRYTTVVAKGTTVGIGSAGKNNSSNSEVSAQIFIGEKATVDAIAANGSNYAISALGNKKSVIIDHSSSVFTQGKAVTGNGSISPVPYSNADRTKKVYEVQFHFATVDNRNLNARNYGKEYFTTNLMMCKSTGYSTLNSDYSALANSKYVGFGHNDKSKEYSLYIYLPEGSYINNVTSYNLSNKEEKFQVNYAVAGYNKIDESGEIMFTAKYDMGEYLNYAQNKVTSANVAANRIDVYPLESFSLETYRLYDSTGNSLGESDRNVIKNAVLNSDGDTYYTWSEVKYYIENMARGTVYVKVLKNSLAFSTITVPDGVTVKMSADNGVKILRAVFDTSIKADMDGIYETPPTGSFPIQGSASETMLSGYDRIKNFYLPSAGSYNATLKYPANGTSNNGLTLPLFHLDGMSDLEIGANINFDNVEITTGYKH